MARAQAARPTHQPGRIRRVLRRATQLGVAAVAVAAVVFGVRWVVEPGSFPIRSVHVQGGIAHVSQSSLREAIAPFVGAGLLRIDVAGLREAVEALPWIRHAAIRRAWPDTLVVRVEEQRPLAHWVGGGLLNVYGERFEPEGGALPAGLPVIGGPPGAEKAATERFEEMRRMLHPLGLQVARLSVDARRALELELDTGMLLRLGRRQASGRMLRFVRSYAKALARHGDAIREVDLRYTNGFAVRWKEGREPVAA